MNTRTVQKIIRAKIPVCALKNLKHQNTPVPISRMKSCLTCKSKAAPSEPGDAGAKTGGDVFGVYDAGHEK
jgi:hypothetical protein